MTLPKDKDEQQVHDGKIFSILAYLSILCIIPLLLKKDNAFVLSHSKQGLVIFLGEVAVFIAHIVLGQWILRLGLFVFGVFSFWGIVRVLKGQQVDIPIISDIADKITL